MASKLKEALSRGAAALGLAVIPNWRLERHSEADFLRRLFRLLEIDCVLDVGANLGQYRDFLRSHVGFDGPIVSFEPIPKHADYLRERAKKDPKWMIHDCALGSEPGVGVLNVMASTVFSSFLDPDHTNVPEFSEINDVRQQLEVQVRTLDDIFPDLENLLGARRPYLKLDTQGFDLEVVKGAAKTLTKICALQTEASIKPIYRGMPDYATSIETLRSLGFEPSAFFPVDPAQFPVLIEFDCFMVSTRFLPTTTD